MPRVFAVALLALVTLHPGRGALAADISSADRIEEDWEVVIGTPDSNVTGPQVSTTMKIDADDSSPVSVFNLNYRDSPAFIAGGVQAKVRSDGQTVATSSQGTAQLRTDNETITWTQRLSLAGGALYYKVTSGKSTTWGDFGASDDELAVSTTTSLSSLSGYSPDDSVKNSGPSFGSNLVTKMTLVRVRYYQGQTLLSTDETARPVKQAD